MFVSAAMASGSRTGVPLPVVRPTTFELIINLKTAYNKVAATKTMIKRTEQTQGMKPKRLLADTAYGTRP